MKYAAKAIQRELLPESQHFTSLMKRRIRAFILPIAVISLTGCIPGEFVEVPALRGRVVDFDHRPVPDATLRITARISAYPRFTFCTHSDGTFACPEQSRFSFVIPGADLAWPFYSLTVFSPAGQSSAIQIPSGFRTLFLFGPPRTGLDLGDIQVH